jgi:hypothetical protein
MEIRAAEISDIIKRQIQDYEREVEVRETGRVLSTGDGIARIYGLDKAAAGELLEFPHHIYGLVLNLEEDNVGVALLGNFEEVREGHHDMIVTGSSQALGPLRHYIMADLTRSILNLAVCPVLVLAIFTGRTCFHRRSVDATVVILVPGRSIYSATYDG